MNKIRELFRKAPLAEFGIAVGSFLIAGGIGFNNGYKAAERAAPPEPEVELKPDHQLLQTKNLGFLLLKDDEIYIVTKMQKAGSGKE